MRLLFLIISLATTQAQPLSNGSLVKIAGNFGFLEGPVWNAKEQTLYFSDMKTSTIHRWKSGIDPAVFLRTDPAPNGLAFDSEDRLVFCQPGTQSIIAINPDGSQEILAKQIGDRPFAPTNDVFSINGTLFITIPDRKGKDQRLTADTFIQGAIVAIPEKGKPLVVSATLDLRSPNGITGSEDGKHLFYTNAGKVWRTVIGADLTLSDPEIVALTGWDGLTIDEKGNIYTTSERGVAIYSPGAELLLDIPVPEPTTNFCFGGPEGKTLFIAARTALYSMEMNVRGDR